MKEQETYPERIDRGFVAQLQDGNVYIPMSGEILSIDQAYNNGIPVAAEISGRMLIIKNTPNNHR